MLITFRNTHYKKKKKKPLISLPFDSISCPYKLFSALPHQPLSLISSFQPQSANPITSKKKKKRHTFYSRPTFHSSKRSFGTTFFDIKQLSSHFPPSHQISVPKWGNSYYSIAIAIFFLLSETYINRSDKLGSRRKKFKLAGGIGSLNMGCRKK